MKRAIICGICKHPSRYSESYAIKLFNYDPEKMNVVNNIDGINLQPAVAKVRVCLPCARDMGYITKKTAKQKKLEAGSLPPVVLPQVEDTIDNPENIN